MKKVLVISPHADDETLGAGGALLKYKSAGHEISCLNITNLRLEYGYTQPEILKKQKEIQTVCDSYGFHHYIDFGLQPMCLDQYPKKDFIHRISKIIQELKPEILLLPYFGDIHSDHRIVFEAAIACTKVFRYPFVKQIFCMEIPSETEFCWESTKFTPNYFVAIEEQIKRKLEIMSLYKSEMGVHPFPRSTKSIEALAVVRGSMAGHHYAEAFQIIKYIAD